MDYRYVGYYTKADGSGNVRGMFSNNKNDLKKDLRALSRVKVVGQKTCGYELYDRKTRTKETACFNKGMWNTIECEYL